MSYFKIGWFRLLLSTLLSLVLSAPAFAELTLLNETQLEDSEESFSRRIYSYNFDLDANGTAHIIYSKPIVGGSKTHIIYTRKALNQAWDNASQLVLEDQGLLSSISTSILVDKSSNIAHISYIVDRSFIDSNGATHAQGLVYQQINLGTGVASDKVNVSSGGFHTRMQLNASGQPMFIRETELWEGNVEPFPKALKLLLPNGTNSWQEVNVANLPTSQAYYRIASFVYDSQRNRIHITYGDKNAVALASAYPTTNPTQGSSGVYFPPGSGHNLRYAYSDDNGVNWVTSTIDDTGNLSENEFWATLTLNANGVPYAGLYKYATNALGIHEGSANRIGSYDAATNSWSMQYVAGLSSSEHRAGMGVGLVFDEKGGLHGVWDNSPDKPIEANGVAGNLMYRYSPDSVSWRIYQALRPYSIEGYCRIALKDNILRILVLGDATNARLLWLEFQLPSGDQLEVRPTKRLYAPGEQILIHAYAHTNTAIGQQGDWYALVAGPMDKQADDSYLPAPSFKYSYMDGSLNWQSTNDFAQVQAAIGNTPLINFYGDINTQVAGAGIFQAAGTYEIYSVLTAPGSRSQWLSSLFMRRLHVCSQANCAEIQ